MENSPAATPTADGARVVEIDGTRLTLLGVSGGVTFVDKDGEKSGDQKRQYVKAVFLIEGKAGGIGELKINGQPRKTVHPDSAALSASIQVDHARAHWPAAERMEKIPEHAKDTDVIFEQTHIGVEPLPPKLSVSLEIGGRTFEFVDVSP